MVIQRIEEFLIDPATRAVIQELLRRCFPGYPDGQSYFKQLPDFRFLAWEDERLVAQMAVEHRLINNGGALRRIFGVVDLCVEPAFQHHQLATRLLHELEVLGLASGVNFLLLLAKDHELYQKNGFQLVHNVCRWLLIHRHETLGVAHRTIERTLMIKPLDDQTWQPGLVDFLGHIF